WRPVPALAALWWHLTRRRVRARNRLRTAGGDLPFAYRFWMRNIEDADRLEECAPVVTHSWASRPCFTIIVDARGCSSTALEKSCASIRNQAYEEWSLTVVSSSVRPACVASADVQTADTLRSAVEKSAGDF